MLVHVILSKEYSNVWTEDLDYKPIVEFLVNQGYQIKIIPAIENVKPRYHVEWSNPDIIINGKLADIKTVEDSISSRLKSAKNQKLRNAVLVIPDNFTEEQINEAFSKWKEKNHGRLNVIWIWRKTINQIVFGK